LPDGKKSQHGGAVPFAVLPRQAALAALVVKSIAGAVLFALLYTPSCTAKPLFFSKPGLCQRGCGSLRLGPMFPSKAAAAKKSP